MSNSAIGMVAVALWCIALSTGCARSGFDEILLEQGDPVPWHDLGDGPAASDESSFGYIVWAQEPLALAIDQRGNAVLAYSNSTTVEARRWSGALWEDLGSPGAGNMVTLARDDEDRPWVAWNVTGSPAEVRVAMHDNETWQGLADIQYGTPLPDAAFAYPTLVFDSAGRAILAAGSGGGSGGDAVCVHRYEASTWHLLAAPSPPCFTSDQQRPALAAGNDGALMVAHVRADQVVSFDWGSGSWGTGASVLASGVWSEAWPAAIATETGDTVAWYDGVSSMLLRQRTGVTWAELDGSSTMPVGALNAAPALAASPHGEPVVAWTDGATVYVRYWTGSAWADALDSFTTGIFNGQVGVRPAVAVHDRQVCVAFTAGSDTEFDVYVRCATPRW